LALVRRALGPPYEWKLICFDETEEDLLRMVKAVLPAGAEGSIAELASQLSPDDMVELSVARDAQMANRLTAEWKKLGTSDKVLAVCGNIHARTANHATDESPLKPLWPSFAAVLKRDQPDSTVRSINLQAFGGEFYNGGKFNRFTARPLDNVEARPTPGTDWDWELNLPSATAATFLRSPL
jgi:hypothetical protein